MNRTHVYLSLAAALSLVALLQPASRWVDRMRQPKVDGAATSSVGGTLRLDGALSHQRPLEGGATYIRYDVKATDAKAKADDAVQMVLVIDRSGSMSGEKIMRARAAAAELVSQLSDRDELGVVTFGSDTTELALQRADAEGKDRMRTFIDHIFENGGTNISGGLARAEEMLKRAEKRGVRRVVLMSDGQPTEGKTSTDELVGQVVALHEQGLAVTALGIGYDFNGNLMQRLAERGGGFYAYLNAPERLAEVLRLELAQARGAVARNVTLELELAGGAELVQVAGREHVRVGNTVKIPLQDFAPGQSAQAFLELKLPAGTTALTATAKLTYFDAVTGAAQASENTRLAANTVDDAATAEASKDEKVAAECIRAAGSTKMVAAAEAFERGDRGTASALLENARSLFAMSGDALAGDEADVRATQDRWNRTTDPQAIANESKTLTRKKMLNFGENNAY